MLAKSLSTLLLLSAGASLAGASPVAVSESVVVPTAPGTTTFETYTPSVKTADGGLDSTLLQRDHKSTFAKLEDIIEGCEAGVKATRRRSAQVKATTKSVPLSGDGTYFAATVSIGTPAQKLPLMVDTGSSDLWVLGNTADGDGLFNYANSSTIVNSGKTVNLTYVTESVTGGIATDTISVGGLTVKNQAFGVVPSEQNFGVSGILGLAPADIAKISAPTFFSNLVSSGQLASPSFGLYLSRDASKASELTLGGENAAHYSGKQSIARVVPGFGRWVLQLDYYMVNGTLAANLPTTAIIDSGSSTSFIPKKAAAAIFAKIPGAYLDTSAEAETSVNLMGQTYTLDRYAYPCGTTSRPGYVFNGTYRRVLPVATEDLNLGYIDEETKKMCAATIIGVDIELGGKTMALLGTDFLKSYYTVFNFGTTDEPATIKFATAKA
ncbi:hypothetical protein JCM8097_002734 [Rhodosporidiobolus ruineniae]